MTDNFSQPLPLLFQTYFSGFLSSTLAPSHHSHISLPEMLLYTLQPIKGLEKRPIFKPTHCEHTITVLLSKWGCDYVPKYVDREKALSDEFFMCDTVSKNTMAYRCKGCKQNKEQETPGF